MSLLLLNIQSFQDFLFFSILYCFGISAGSQFSSCLFKQGHPNDAVTPKNTAHPNYANMQI